jgi:hypothetical protein
VTRFVSENIAQSVAQHVLVKIVLSKTFAVEKVAQNLAYFFNKKLPKVPKQSLNRRKITQSGHPAKRQNNLLTNTSRTT